MDAIPLQTAIAWDSSFVHSAGPETGVKINFALGSAPKNYQMPADSLRPRMAHFTLLLWHYPIDTVLRKNRPQQPGVFGPWSEYRYDFRNNPFVFQGVNIARDTQAVLPLRVDSTGDGFFFSVPPGRYLLSINPWVFQAEPEVIKDLDIRNGDFSVIKIALMPPPIY